MKRTKIVVLILAGCILTGCIGKKNLKDGIAFLEEKKYEEAVTAFQKEIEKEKNMDEAYRGMGMAYYEMQEYEHALESFQEALKQEAEATGTLYHLMAQCHVQMENYEAALQAFQKALEMKGLSEEVRQEIEFNIVVMYERLGDWTQAREAVLKYIEKYPEDAKAAKEAEFLKSR